MANPLMARTSGILLHPTSLPGPFGVGDLGPEAHRFADFLAAAGQKIWQVLPLGPTGYGDSPYQCFSAFAGNPLLISLERLRDEGLLAASDLENPPPFPEERADYGWARVYKLPLLSRSYHNFAAGGSPELRRRLEAFEARESAWLDDYALFMALKEAHGGEAVWTRWEAGAASRDPAALASWRDRLATEIAMNKFLQFAFFEQWGDLKDACHARGIHMMGDLPIYVAHDSADVWANRGLFYLDEAGEPSRVAGVPPDYFSATGQLWGNPIYRWAVLARGGYQWWVERFRATLSLFDVVRVDHFRGFEAYWEVPGGEKTAINGQWIKGPGAALFEALHSRLGEMPLVAENLGVITPEVEAIRHKFNFPGMSILQFAFGTDPQAPDFKPHNYPRDRVAYTGTHDNDTTVGWWNSTGEGDSTRTAEDIRTERDLALRYLNSDGAEIHWTFIRALMASVANTVLVPLQDLLGLGTEARMNLPATSSGNWRWRFRAGNLEQAHAARLRELTVLYDR